MEIKGIGRGNLDAPYSPENVAQEAPVSNRMNACLAVLIFLCFLLSTSTGAEESRGRAILAGAKKQIGVVAWDRTMGYYRSPGEGVCTDVVLDAFFSAGIDLRTLLAEDIRAHREEYPFAEGNSIDARRARVLVDWFRRHWEPLPLDRDFLPGDVVFYTGTYRSDGVADHVGIVSDKSSSEGVPLIIDNFPDPGYVSETADVFCAEMIGHFRVRSEGNSDTGSPE